VSDTEKPTDVVILQVIEQVERRASERETKRFRSLYALVALVSFVGIGVISQLIELYATRAVDQRLEQTRVEFESAKIFTQLLSLATKLDLSDSFSNTDRDAVMRLLEMSVPNKKLRSEPAFESLLEKIIDSFAASENPVYVSRVFDMYESECLRVAGITDTLIQHYAKRLIQSTDPQAGEVFVKDYKRFQVLVESAESFKLQGTAAALRSLVAFRMAGSKPTPELTSAMDSYTRFNERERSRFMSFIVQFSDPKRLAKRPRPDEQRISATTLAFASTYPNQIAVLGRNASPDGKDDD